MIRFSMGARVRALLGLVILSSAGITLGQTVTGSISGTVKDSSGAVLPGAQIVLLNEDTGVSRTVQSDVSGRYSASSLTLGNYQVKASQTGFQTEVRSGIMLTVGREAVVDLALSVGTVTQTLEVTGEAATIETMNATVSGLVNGGQIRELPLNGRSYTDLALLTPGVIYNRVTGSNPGDGYGVRMSANGDRGSSNLYLIDGQFAANASDFAGSVAVLSLGVEGVREFRVLTHNYGAEYGRLSGSVVSVVTRSGTNQFHGSLYEFVRNNIFDARDFFNVGALPAYRRNQFGAAVGGPVKKDRIFFFANYEGLQQRQALTFVATVPNANARQGLIPNATTGQLTQVTLSQVMVPYLALYPLPNGRDLGNGTALWNGNASQPTSENYGLGRLDFRLTDKDNLYVRYIDNPSTQVLLGAANAQIPFWSRLDQVSDHLAFLSETHIFSGNSVNEFRAGFNRSNPSDAPGPSTIQVPSNLSFNPGLPIGQFVFSSGALANVGNIRVAPAAYQQNVFEEGDSFSKVRGAHSLKFGVDLQRIQFNPVSFGDLRGTWTFGSLQNFLAGLPSQLQGKFIGPVPGGQSSVEAGWRRWYVAWFVQDDYHVSSRLTLNLGLRQEFFTPPVEVNGLMAALINVTDSASTLGSPYHPSKLNFAPRVGLAWDPTGSGKTSVRLGAGIYYNQMDTKESGPPSDYRFNASYTLACPCPTFPLVPTDPSFLAKGGLTESMVGQGGGSFPTPTIAHFGLDVQRQITNTVSLKVGYVGWYGYNLTRKVSANIRVATTCPAAPCPASLPAGTTFFSPTSPRINPGFGPISELLADTVGNYNGLQAVFQKNAGAGLLFQASYTYSKALTEADATQNVIINNIGTSVVSLNKNNPSLDYGRSGYDQRQTFVFNSQYSMPWDHLLKGGMEKAFLGGWALNGIWSYGSGLPLNINVGFSDLQNLDDTIPDRPNMAPGFSNNPTSGVTAGCQGIPAGQQLRTPNRWFDPCAFTLPAAGTFGNLGRDTVNGPNFDVVNVALVKNTALTERAHLEFRGELFNLFNHPSFGLPNIKVFSSTGLHTASEGLITTTVSQGRQIQLGMKLTF